MAKTKKEESKFVTVISPIGIVSYPYLIKPDIGRKESSMKFSAELYVPKPVFLSEGKEMVAQVLKVAREYHDDKKLNLSDIQSPFKDMDTVKDALDWQKNTFRIRAKAGKKDMSQDEWNKYRPTCIGPVKNEEGKFPVLSLEEIAAIKGGDHGRFICSVYGYSQQGGGVALGLNFFQFAKVGKALGQGKLKAIEGLGEIEVALDDPSSMVDTEEDDEVKPVKKGKKEVVQEEEDDTDPMMQFA